MLLHCPQQASKDPNGGFYSLPRRLNHQPLATPSPTMGNPKALPPAPPLSICDGCVRSSPQESHHDRFATTLVPLTDKEIEVTIALLAASKTQPPFYQPKSSSCLLPAIVEVYRVGAPFDLPLQDRK